MPRVEKGTPRKLKIWLEKAKPAKDDELDLTLTVAGELATLQTWNALEALADPSFEAHVFDLAQSNADERGTTTLYTVRHRRGDLQRAEYAIRCRAETSEEPNDFDGSATMLITGLYKQNTTLLAHVLSQTANGIAPLMKALEVAQARIQQLESERNKQSDDAHKLRNQLFDALEKAKASAGEDDAVFEARLMKLWGLAKMAGFAAKD